MEEKKKFWRSYMQKGNPWALLPFVVFLVLFIGSGIILDDFYAFPVIVAIAISSAVALAMNRKESLNTKVDIFCKGAGNPNVMLMVVIFLLAGAFSETAKGMGAVDATVNFALSVIPQNFLVVGLFIIACFISLAMGTSVGTIVALSSITMICFVVQLDVLFASKVTKVCQSRVEFCKKFRLLMAKI